MPKGQGSSILWRRVLIGAQGTRNGKIVCHVWMGKDGLWRGSATGIKEFFGPFEREADARESTVNGANNA